MTDGDNVSEKVPNVFVIVAVDECERVADSDLVVVAVMEAVKVAEHDAV